MLPCVHSLVSNGTSVSYHWRHGCLEGSLRCVLYKHSLRQSRRYRCRRTQYARVGVPEESRLADRSRAVGAGSILQKYDLARPTILYRTRSQRLKTWNARRRCCQDCALIVKFGRRKKPQIITHRYFNDQIDSISNRPSTSSFLRRPYPWRGIGLGHRRDLIQENHRCILGTVEGVHLDSAYLSHNSSCQ